MSEVTAERRLAAILAADVVGYSRLMARDESGTLSLLRKLRADIIDPSIAGHKGRLFKTMGDGFLAEFPSVVNAVACAIDIQNAATARNAAHGEQDIVQLRIGINLGDVLIEGEDVFGDGVNIAARLEAIAPPGGIVVSAMVKENVGTRLDIAFEDMGEQLLKNIALPVRAYRSLAGTAGRRTPLEPGDAMPSIAVLPFTSFNDDAEQRLLSDGLTEDIITELARFRQLRVIARNSSFRFRGDNLDLVRIGRELGARYIVEGSLRRMGKRIRITAQLIDAITGHHIWAEKFDRDQNDIFEAQDELVHGLVATLTGNLQAFGAEQAKRKPPASLAAYEYVLRADALPINEVDSIAEARKLYEAALQIDPSYARATALLALNYNLEWVHDLEAPENLLDHALDLANRAVLLDDRDSLTHSVLGVVHLDRGAFDLAEHHCRRAMELNPNRPTLLASYGVLQSYAGAPLEGLKFFERARALDPAFEPTWFWPSYGRVHFNARQYSGAIDKIGRSRASAYYNEAYLAAAHARLENGAAAARHAANVMRLAPRFTAARFIARERFRQPADREHLVESLRMAGLPER